MSGLVNEKMMSSNSSDRDREAGSGGIRNRTLQSPLSSNYTYIGYNSTRNHTSSSSSSPAVLSTDFCTLNLDEEAVSFTIFLFAFLILLCFFNHTTAVFYT